VQNGLCLYPEKSQALIISLQPVPTTSIPPIVLNGCVVPYCDKVKNLGLIMNSEFTWKDQVKALIQKIYATLRRLWTFANFLPTPICKKLVVALIVPLLLNNDVIFSKAAIGLTNRLKIALNSCARFIYNVPTRDPISEHANKILGVSLSTYYSYRICCQMFKIVNRLSPSYLSDRLHVGHSLRTRVLHYSRHSLASTTIFFSFVGRPCGIVYRFRSETRVEKGDSGQPAWSF
jgi:hypothetical protein